MYAHSQRGKFCADQSGALLISRNRPRTELIISEVKTGTDKYKMSISHRPPVTPVYVDSGSYDDPKIDWLEADPFKWSVIIGLV